MTHSLHRQGSAESLKNDYVMYARCARGINLEGAAPKVRKIVNIVFDEGPDNAGDSRFRVSMADGTMTREKALEIQDNTNGFMCCFNSREKMKRVLERLKEEEIGISVVVSGLIDEVTAMAREVGLKPHTINMSLGIWGKKELLPGPEVLEMTTMCGHGLVPAALVKKAVADVEEGKKTPREAASMVGQPCICGFVNLSRATKMFAEGK